MKPTFDRFAICDGFYRFAVDYHGGQWSAEYAIFGRLIRMRYKAVFSVAEGRLVDFARCNPDAWEVYKRLARKQARVRNA